MPTWHGSARSPGVTSALPVVDGQVLLTDDRGDNTGGYVRGIRRDDLRQLHAVSDNVRAGSLDAFDGPDAIAVGVTLANRFGLAPGSKLTLVSPQGAATAFGTIPRVRAYTVTTIFQVGMNEYDSGYVFLPLDAAQIFFQQPGAVTQIEVRVDDADHARQIGRSILQALSGTPVRVIDWQQNNNSFFEAIQVEKTVMFVLLSLITGVAMLSVVNTLIMLIKDKAADIAVLRTLGAGRGAIARVFVMVGLAIGLAGTALGAVLGVLFCRNIQFLQTAVEAVTGRQVFNPTVYYLAHLPARLDPGEIFRICVISVILSALATVYPSLRAAWTDPVAALRDA